MVWEYIVNISFKIAYQAIKYSAKLLNYFYLGDLENWLRVCASFTHWFRSKQFDIQFRTKCC